MSAQLAAAGAAASLSMADVDFTDVGKKEGSQFTFMGLLTLLLAGGSATFAVLSMVIVGSPVAIASGVIALAVTPVALFQRFNLNRMATLRDVHNKLRQDVSRFSSENDDLERQITRLGQKAERVQIVESQLQKIVGEQGGQIDSFVNLVKENGKLLDEMDELLMAQVAQQIMTTIVRSDRDQDFQIDDEEIDGLIFRVRSIQGVEQIDEEKLRQQLKTTRGIHSVFQMIKDFKKTGQDSAVKVSSRSLRINIQ